MSIRSKLAALPCLLVVLSALAVLFASPAQAYENIEPGFNYFTATPSTSQAGGHPNVSMNFEYRIDNEVECRKNCLSGRRVGIHWPEGFIGNPHVAPKCGLSEFNTARCASDSQVGKFILSIGELEVYVPIYNMETRPDQAGLLGFTTPLITFPVFLELTGRTNSDYGLDAISTPQVRLPFTHFQVVLWGVPAEPANDVDRFVTPLTGTGACYISPKVAGCPPGGESFLSPTYAPPTVPAAPFLQNPTTCGVPLTLVGEVEYYGGTMAHIDVPWPATTGCNQASFTPSVTAKPTTGSADTASGLDAKLKVPQTQSPITPAPSELKSAKVTLPEGFSINPGAADGKVACADALSAIGTLLAATCPENSKIGTLMLDIAALPEPIPGALYLAEPKPGEPYRVLLTASGFATNVKLLGRVDADPQSGRVSMLFEHLPQSPLQEFDLHIFGSERGLLATPSHCGTFAVESEFVPWNTALTSRTTQSLITIDSGPNGTPCPNGARGLAPQFDAGVADGTAARHTPFNVLVRRADGEQNLAGLTLKTPPGFLAALKGVSYCPEAAIASVSSPGSRGAAETASPACPAASQVGTATAGAGAGTHPLFVPGKVYLAGPYKGAPLSLLVVLPAVSGPYDLGNVAVRAQLRIDPVTAQVTTISDPLPQIMEGIPLRTRSILISLDRPGFTVNPTNCSPFAVEATVTGTEGGAASPSRRFQVANCADLDFGPKLGLRLSGGVNRRGHPAIHATVSAKPGEANISRVTTALPKGELLDNSHIGTPCTRPQFASGTCPESSRIGTAEAVTPLLDKPLSGNVYLRVNPAHKLPDIVADLRGQIDIELAGKVDTVKGGALRTTFEGVPDAPVTSFRLDLLGGAKGLLQNSKSLCGKRLKATTTMLGQNAVALKTSTKLQASCGSKARHKRHHAKRKEARG